MLGLLSVTIVGCGQQPADSDQTPDAARSTARIGDTVLSGKVLQKPATKSYEAWNAGGTDYFVLDVGQAQVKERTAKEGVILRPSDEVSRKDLAAWVGTKVRVSGTFVGGKPYEPADEGESYPMGLGGEPELRGSGFAVTKIEAAD